MREFSPQICANQPANLCTLRMFATAFLVVTDNIVVALDVNNHWTGLTNLTTNEIRQFDNCVQSLKYHKSDPNSLDS